MYIVKNNNKKKRIVEKSRQMINLRRKKNVWIFVLYTLRHIRVRMLYIFLSILFIHFRIWLSMKEKKKNDEMEF